MRELRALSPTGALGHTPIEEESFYEGLKREPHFLGADAGSGDIGPYYLGTDTRYCAPEWEEFDLELMLTAARERKVPLIIASSDGCGTNRATDQLIETVRRIADRRKLAPFKLGTFYSEVDLNYLADRVKQESVKGLGAPAPLTLADVERSSHVVAMAGIEPFQKLLEMGAEVIIAGRACDDAIFAAIPAMQGYPLGLCYHLGKVLECASMSATPLMLHETMIGTIRDDAVLLEPMHPIQRATPESVAGHSLYERTHPYYQAMPGGVLDMTQTVYAAVNDRTVRVSGSVFKPASPYCVKLEGAGVVGHKHLAIVGLRDPFAIGRLDEIIASIRAFIAKKYPNTGDYQLFFHTYGKDGVMGRLEPTPVIRGHEVCIVVEAMAKSKALAKVIATMGYFRFFAARYEGQKQNAGGAALLNDQVLDAGPACAWTVDHLLPLDDPLALFPTKVVEIR